MSSSTVRQQSLSEENDTPTTTVFGKFENPELDFPIKVGHVLYKLKKNSIKKVSEWATAHNSRIGFPEVSMNVIKCIRRKKLKFHSTQLKYVFLAANAHGQGQSKNVPASSEDAASASSFLPRPSCEDCQAKELKIESITEELNALKKELESVRKENSNLKKELEAKNKKILTHNTIRKLYYACLIKNVSERNVISLVKCFLHLLGLRGIVYSRSTAQRMVGEIGFMADIQTVQAILDSENITIAFDSTTQDGVHVNCLQICTPVDSFLINIEHLPGGTAIDYCSHIFNSLKYLADEYSSAYHLSSQEILNKIVGKVKCVLSDRASVNHATICLLEKKIAKSLVELNCNIHPLEAITREILKNIQQVESKASQNIFSNQSCLIYNIISSVNSLRYSNKKGSIKDFKNALQESGFTVPRFRGNRINIVFHLSFVYFFHKEALLHSLNCVENELARKIICCFDNEEVNIELQVFAIIDKILSGPWMTIFYSSLDDQKPIVEGLEMMKKLLETVEGYCCEPLEILNFSFDFFGNHLSEEIKKYLFQLPSNQTIFSSMMGVALKCICSVIKRQYSKQFMSIDILRGEDLSSARQHTMEVESIIGEFSNMKRSASNSNVSRISNLIKAKRNKIMELLDSPTVSNFINLAKTQSNLAISRNIVKKAEVFAEERQRLIGKKQAHEDKKKKLFHKCSRNNN